MRCDRPRVVILGGGFGGLYAARALKRSPVDLTLVDRQNHHLFQPLLYQVAARVVVEGARALPALPPTPPDSGSATGTA